MRIAGKTRSRETAIVLEITWFRRFNDEGILRRPNRVPGNRKTAMTTFSGIAVDLHEVNRVPDQLFTF
jgi:hypothetical protein